MVNLILRFVIQLCNILEPVVLQRIKCSYSFVGVDYQQLLDQIYDFLGARLELCMFKMKVTCRYLIEHFIPILSLEW